MSWFERRRHRAVEALGGQPAAVLAQPTDPEVDRTADVPAVDATDLVVGQGVVGQGVVEPAERPEQPSSGGLPTISGRAGRYVVTDETGASVGTILGDYVIGFTVDCWNLQRTFSDMESAMAAIALESQAQAAARLLKAS